MVCFLQVVQKQTLSEEKTKTLINFNSQLCQKYFCQILWKSTNLYSRHDWCLGCFSGFLFLLTHILLDLLSLGSAEAYIGWGGKLNSHLMASCQEYLYQKLSKSDIWFSSYSRKCRGCFFWDTAYIRTSVHYNISHWWPCEGQLATAFCSYCQKFHSCKWAHQHVFCRQCLQGLLVLL